MTTPREKRDLAAYITVCAGLLALAYATPAKLRPALSVIATVFISRAHGRGRDRLELTIRRLFDEKVALTPRVDDIAIGLEEAEVRIEDLELAHTPFPGRQNGQRRILERVRARL